MNPSLFKALRESRKQSRIEGDCLTGDPIKILYTRQEPPPQYQGRLLANLPTVPYAPSAAPFRAIEMRFGFAGQIEVHHKKHSWHLPNAGASA